MKKIIFLTLTILFSISGFSQFLTAGGNEGFETTIGPDSPTNPSPWTLGTGATGNQWAVFDNGVGLTRRWNITTVTTNIYAGVNSAYMDRENLGAGFSSEDYLATPLVTIPTNGQLRFWTRSTVNGTTADSQYLIKINTNTAVGSQTIPANYTITPQQWTDATLTTVFNVYEEKVVDLSAYAGQTVYIAFVLKNSQSTGSVLTLERWLIDNIRLVQQCLAPTGLAATPQATTASLSWADSNNANSYEVEVVPTGVLPTGTGIPTTSNPYIASGLTANTPYDYYIRVVCGPGLNSIWVGPFPFTTTVAPIGCNGNYVDSGGLTGNYSNNENSIIPICPANSTDIVTVTFTAFNTIANEDILNIYNGNSTAAPLLGSYSGTNIPPSYSSSSAGGCLTFEFISNGFQVSTGWIANIVCSLAPTCFSPTSLATTVITSNSGTLTWNNNNASSDFEVLALPCGSPAPNAASVGTSITPATNTHTFNGLTPDTCYTLYVRSICSPTDKSTWSLGINITTQIAPPVCGGIFTDAGGVANNYPNDSDSTVTICPVDANDVVTVTFNSFNTETNWDGLYVFNGNSILAPQVASLNGPGFVPGGLAGSYWGTAIPGPFTSSSPDGCLTFRFRSDGIFNFEGWEALVTCDLPPTCPGPTVPIASAVTSNSGTLTWTNNSSATQFEVVALPCNSPLPTPATVGTIFTPTTPNTYVFTGLIPDTCYTLYVRAVCTPTDSSNWSAGVSITTQIAPPVCGGFFTDLGGANGNYAINTDNTVTICPINPLEIVTVTFTEFDTEANWDGLYVFDGNSVLSPQIPSANGPGNVPGGLAGSFWGTEIPGPFTSSLPGGCLTFRFRSDGVINNPGWNATVSCDPIPTCPKPVLLTTTNITASSATLSWTEIGTATAWEILVLPIGSPLPIATSLGIATTNPYFVTNLPPATAYTFYVRSICSLTDIGPWSAGFTFGTLPLNDNCANATFAVVNQNLNCVQTTPGSLIGATQSLPNINCPPGVANDDVWYTFTATAATHVISFNNVLPANTDINYAIFQGTDCGTLTQVACNSGAGLTAGVTYYIRIYSTSALPQFATFNLCIGTLPCTEAPAFCTGQTVTYNNSTNVPSLGQIGCLFTSPNPAFFFLQVNQAGPLTYLISQEDTNGVPRDVDYVAWGPFTDLSSACSGVPQNPLAGILPAPTPADGCPGTLHACSYSAAPTEIMCIPDAQLCQVYVIMITNFSNQAGSVTFTQTNAGGGTTACFPINTFNYPLTTYCQDGIDPTPVLAPGASAGTYTSTPGLVINPVTGTVDLSASIPGAYIVTSSTATTIGGTCSTIPFITTTRTIIITAPASATISYTNSSYCNNVNTIQTITRTGTVGGSYSASPAGLSLDSNTGNIVPSVSLPGVYTVTYSIPSLGGCLPFSTPTTVTIIATPILVQPLPVTACGNYTLPVLTVGNYYTATGGTGTMLNAGDSITSSQIVYIYAESGTIPNCTSEKSFSITISNGVVDVLSNLSACNSYMLPTLSANNNYYTSTGGTGTMLNAGEVINSTQMIYIYYQLGNCIAESEFLVTINTTPNADSSSDVSACDSYILPTLTVGNYYTATGGNGTMLTAGDVITSSQTIYIYAQTNTIPNCSDENSFVVTINTTPNADSPLNVTACDSYTLPTLTVGNYYTATGGTGTLLNAGTVITSTQTIYVYAQITTTPNCSDENSFVVTINTTPNADSPLDVTACDSFTLPTLTVGNYYTATGGTGTLLNAGAVITSTQTIYVYAQTSSIPNCFDENSFVVTINPTPTINSIGNVTACNSYILPNLANGNYFTGINGTGVQLNSGTSITSSQTIYVYAQTNTTPNCSAQTSFSITINNSPVINPINDVNACNNYTLPILSVGNYYTDLNGTGTQINNGTIITTTTTLHVYAINGTCSDEETFEITITPSPSFTIVGGCVANVYVLEIEPSTINNASYSWTGPNGVVGNNSPTLQVPTNEAGSYSCLVSIPNGSGICSNTETFIANDVTCSIPRGISPNGDSLNDTFDLTGLNVKLLSIYNRYGSKVYSKSDYTNQWEGQSNAGEELPDGTYYYVIERNGLESKSGWVYINRENK
jgi:gliding motility-associated-like protein